MRHLLWIAPVVALAGVAFAGTVGGSHFVDATPSNYINGSGASAGPLHLGDDEPLYTGSSNDCWTEWETGTTPDRWELECTDVDGGGTDGVVCSVDQGTDDLVCSGDVDVTGDLTAGTLQGQTVSLSGTLTVEAGGCTCNQDVTSDAYATFAGVALTVPTLMEPAGTTQTITWTDGILQRLDLGSATGTVTITWAGAAAGRQLALEITQAATARAITWPATVDWDYGSAPTLSTGEDEVDIVHCYIFVTGVERCRIVGQASE